MKRALILSLSLAFIFTFQAFACFNPTDMFAAEVLLSNPGATYDMAMIRSAENVSFEEGAFIYRSHFDARVAVILEEVDESAVAEVLKGLSVKIQIPTENVMITVVSTTLSFEFEDVAIGVVDKDALSSLGYEVNVLDAGMERGIMSISLGKENVNVSINQGQDEGRSFADFRASIEEPAVFNNELKEEFMRILATLGLDETIMDRIAPQEVKVDMEDLTEAVDVDKDTFDFGSAMKMELDWLATNGIISGVDDGDIAKIADIAEAGLAGWNSRIVFEREKWLPYNQTGNPMLFRDAGCGGFDLDKLPWNEDTIILPPPSSVSSEGKLATNWGRIKTAQ